MVSFPRLVLVGMWLLSTILQRAYHGMLIPILGFIFLPITTIAYAWMVTHGMPLEGVNVIILVVAVLRETAGPDNHSRQIPRLLALTNAVRCRALSSSISPSIRARASSSFRPDRYSS